MAGAWLLTAETTTSGRPVLRPGEVESSLQPSVDLVNEDNPNLPILKSGLIVLTTHRLIWLPNPESATPYATSSPAAVPLAAVTHIFHSKKSIKGMFASPRVRFQVSITPDGKVQERGSKSTVITLVFRGKSDPDSFVGKFWEAWRGRAWEGSVSGSGEGGSGRVELGDGGGSSNVDTGLAIKMPVVGVSGILRKEQEMWESTDKSLQDAFQDLNALMNKAKDMVALAEKMRQKLLSGSSSQANAANDEEMGSKEEMQDWLLSVGIVSPVTKESAGALYHQELSRQLADFVKVPLERAGGIMNLIDVYCLFNRARGTELISPDDLLRACSLWEKFNVPVMLKKFESGVMVIQNKSHSDEEVLSRIRSLVQKPDALKAGVSATDAARTLGIAPAMAKEHLLAAESKGFLCRDVSPDGFRFYVNIFQDIDPNDPYSVREYGVYDSWIRAALASR
ncbi:vacuolar protein sorting-associated protein 36-like isoform X1 [Bidens hawaiensis]|uniref:vacuolar protein sorting-associated protein 36-like isoform X1 n=1 Tax=Bidens hawaiensis TaxID=980011 RepID=UPI0040496DA8